MNISINDHHKILINITNISYASPTITYYEVTQRDKRSLISESVLSIRINVHSTGENLTHTAYAHSRAGHIWQPFTKLQQGQNCSVTPGMKFWLP
jgi:hypothetical protein